MRRRGIAFRVQDQACPVFPAQVEFHPPEKHADPPVQIVGIGQYDRPALRPDIASRDKQIPRAAGKNGASGKLEISQQNEHGGIGRSRRSKPGEDRFSHTPTIAQNSAKVNMRDSVLQFGGFFSDDQTMMKTKGAFFLSGLCAALPVVLVLGMISCGSQPPAEQPAPQSQSPALPQASASQSAPKTPQTLRPIDALLARIAELCDRGDYAGALKLFDEIDAEDAKTDSVALLKASVYLSSGDPAQARNIALSINAASPRNTRALLVLAAVEQAQGKVKEQKATLEKVLKIDPANAEALTGLGNIAAANNLFRDAASYYDKALASQPGYGDALLGRAWVYRNNRDPKNAEKLLNQAAALYPNWAAPLHERGRLYKAAGYPAAALKDIDAAKALNGNNYFIAVDRGDVLIEMNRKEEALAEFERAKKLNPNYFIAYVYSAGIKDELRDFDGAERDYTTLAKLNPDYYFAFEGVGMHLMRRGDYPGAKDAFMEAYKRARQDSVPYGLLAAMNWMRGENLAAPKQFLEQVLRKTERDSLEWYMVRLYHDLSGDNDIVIRLDREKNLDVKARMLYYLANYYDIRGHKSLADKYFLQVRELGRESIPEWRLNEWALESRGMALN
jgi:tetratricopeptide (TPR) repeat protein